MKKTKKTVMTAALFAAAINLAPSGALEAAVSNDIMDTVFAADESDGESAIEEFENEFQGVYGPPWAMLPESQWRGDIHEDGVIDAYDMITLRKYLLNGTDSEWDAMRADVNGDGEISIADMVMIQKYLLGQISSLYKEPAPPETEIFYPQTTVPQPVYGPPETFTTAAVTTDAIEVETQPPTVPQPVYGPPSMFE